MLDVCRQYTLLTGVPELPPYGPRLPAMPSGVTIPKPRSTKTAKPFRDLDLPCDVIYLDIELHGWLPLFYRTMKVSTTQKMIAALRKGLQNRGYQDPGIKIDENYSVFTEALEKDISVGRRRWLHLRQGVAR